MWRETSFAGTTCPKDMTPQLRTTRASRLLTDASFGVRTNQFGFTITGTSNLVIVVEASTNLAGPAWYPLQTNTLAGGSSYFSDPQWSNYSARFYRLTAGGQPDASPPPWPSRWPGH